MARGRNQASEKYFWRIQGYDSSRAIFEMRVGFGQLTDAQMKDALKALVAKAGLQYEEIVGAYAKRGTRIANELLVVHGELSTHTFWCGSNPHFVATVVDEKERVRPNPPVG